MHTNAFHEDLLYSVFRTSDFAVCLARSGQSPAADCLIDFFVQLEESLRGSKAGRN